MSKFVRSFPALGSAPVRVMTCDDMPELRELLHFFIDQEPGTVLVGEAADGYEALRIAAATSAEVVVLDLGMPGPAPVELVRQLRHQLPAAAIVLFSGTSGAVLGAHRRTLTLEIAKGTEPRTVVQRIRELGRARRHRLS